jgi:hypothetical protein
MWACLEPCPLPEITSFVEDSSRSRKSVFQLFKSHTSFLGHPRIESTGQVIMQAAMFAGFHHGPLARPSRFKNASAPRTRFDSVPKGMAFDERPTKGVLATCQDRASQTQADASAPSPVRGPAKTVPAKPVLTPMPSQIGRFL